MKSAVKSVSLTKALIITLAVAFVALLFFAVPAAFWYCDICEKEDFSAKVLIGVFYLCSPAAVVVIINSLKLLGNLGKGIFFTTRNARYLKLMSNSCLAVVPVCVFACLFFAGFIPITVSAICMFLILRIVKNVFEYGTVLKEENDLTV